MRLIRPCMHASMQGVSRHACMTIVLAKDTLPCHDGYSHVPCLQMNEGGTLSSFCGRHCPRTAAYLCMLVVGTQCKGPPMHACLAHPRARHGGAAVHLAVCIRGSVRGGLVEEAGTALPGSARGRLAGRRRALLLAVT